MKFGEYLENLVRDSGISINALSNECCVNRGGLYSVFKQSRQLKPEQLYTLISKLCLTHAEEEKLTSLYFIDMYGSERYKKILCLIDAIKKCAEDKAYKPDYSDLNSDLMAKLQSFIRENSSVITNYSCDFIEADSLFYDSVKNGQITNFVHILALDDQGNYKYNYNSVFSSVKYMYLCQFPYYYFTSLKPQKPLSLLPYFAIGDKSALLFSREKVVEVNDAESVNILAEEAEKLKQSCKCFGTHTVDIMQIKDSYKKGMADGSTSITLSSYPCLASYVDREAMENAVRQDLPNKEGLVEIAYSHYSNMFKHIKNVIICSESGIKKFAETGNLIEISSDLIQNLDVEHRIGVLRKVIAAIENNTFYLLDEQKIKIPENLELEKYANRIYFGGNYGNTDNFSMYDAFFAAFESYSFVEDFRITAEYIIQSRLVCTKAYAVQFIHDLIAGISAQI